MRRDSYDVLQKNMKRSVRLIVVFLAGISPLVWGQADAPSLPTVPSGIEKQSKPVPLHLLYRHFFAYQNHLDEVAANLQKQGENGSEFRNHFQQKLGFTPMEYAPVRASAERLATELKAHDQRIEAVINSGRAKESRIRRGPADVPAPPPELAQLQIQRDELIKHEVARMNAALGPKRAAQVEALIKGDIAAHAQSLPLHSPTPHDPTKSSLSPFPNGVR